jgi:GDPmannose 4,6-dehydratase
MQKSALITGITGQDGAYLAKLLLSKGYKVYGAARRTSNHNMQRLESLGIEDQVEMVGMELLELSNIQAIVARLKPDEFYNLAGQSFVATSFDQPAYTTDVDAIAVLRILESLRAFSPKTRFYQASTSEMFGKVRSVPQNEETPFYPRSPYAAAKVYAHHITVNYRESYGMYACSGILFNHESPLRGREFVTRKITRGFCRVKNGLADRVELGNLSAARDWGFAGDYVEGIWRMLQQEEADDYVLATGRTNTIRDFATLAARKIDIELQWKGEGLDEVGVDRKTGKVWVAVNPKYYRPAEVDTLLGDASKARTKLGWSPKVGLESLAEMMIASDMALVRQEMLQDSVTAEDETTILAA